MKLPEAGKYYQHFKGNVYYVEGIAKHSETLETLVVYRTCTSPGHPGGDLWVRPANMWFDLIERDTYTGPRFKLFEADVTTNAAVDS